MRVLKLKDCIFKRKCGNKLSFSNLTALQKGDSNLKEVRGLREIASCKHTAENLAMLFQTQVLSFLNASLHRELGNDTYQF